MPAGSWPWVVGTGTGVFDHVGPIKLPVAEVAYRLVKYVTHREARIICLPDGGLGRLESTYKEVERQLLVIAGKGKVNLLGHSQPASHFKRFAARHPRKVGVLVSVTGAHNGSELAAWLAAWTPLGRVGCTKDLAPGSDFLRRVSDEFGSMLESVSTEDRPRVIALAAYRDGVVLPWHSSLIAGAENFVFSRGKPDNLHGATWLETHFVQPNHFNVIWWVETLRAMSRVIHLPTTTQCATAEVTLPRAA